MRSSRWALWTRRSSTAPAYEQMPLVHGELAGDDGGALTVAIFEDFQEVVAGAGIERL